MKKTMNTFASFGELDANADSREMSQPSYKSLFIGNLGNSLHSLFVKEH